MTSDTKKEEFKKYLEKCGVLDTLTKVLVELYEEPEKPSNALEFLRNQIGVPPPTDENGDNVDALKATVAELQLRLEQLTAENEALRSQLEEAQRNAPPPLPQEINGEAAQ